MSLKECFSVSFVDFFFKGEPGIRKNLTSTNKCAHISKLRLFCMTRISHVEVCTSANAAFIKQFLSKQNPPPLGGEECAEELRNYVRFAKKLIFRCSGISSN